MSEKISLTIIPSGLRQDALEVKEALQEILDLLHLAGKGKERAKDFYWKLVSVSMNSPLCVVAEASSEDEDVDVDGIAKEQKTFLKEVISKIINNEINDVELDESCRNIAVKIFKRAHETLGGFVIDFHGGEKEIKVLPKIAARASRILEKMPKAYLPGDRSHYEIGEVEGRLFQFVPHYKNPTINIIDNVTGQIVKCKFIGEKSIKVVQNITLLDMAKGKNVIVSGTVYYNSEGVIDKVISEDIRILDQCNVDYSEIADPMFTSGMGVFEYLEKWAED